MLDILLCGRSHEATCEVCGSLSTILKEVTAASKQTTQEAKDLAAQINFQV